jgi:hypothetical protein
MIANKLHLSARRCCVASQRVSRSSLRVLSSAAATKESFYDYEVKVTTIFVYLNC